MSGRSNLARQLLGLAVLVLALGVLAGGVPRLAHAARPAVVALGAADAATPAVMHAPPSRVARDVIGHMGETGHASYIVMLAAQADTHNTLTDWAAQGQRGLQPIDGPCDHHPGTHPGLLA